MSYTVTSGKKVGVHITDDNRHIYVLFEKTHESNVFPQIPSWSCIAFGEYRDVMRAVVGHACACEGGSLQSGTRRYIKPENYIAAWRRAFENPYLLSNRIYSVRIEPKLDSSKEETAEIVEGHLKLHGRQDLIQPLCKELGRVEMTLASDLNVILALYGFDGPMSPWRIFSEYELDRLALLKPIQLSEKAYVVPSFEAYSLSGEVKLMKIGDGPWQVARATYHALELFISQVIYDVEMTNPALTKYLIQKFREICTDALPLPESTRITVEVNDETPDYIVRSVVNCFNKVHRPFVDGKGEFYWADVLKNDVSSYDYQFGSKLKTTWHVMEPDLPTSRPTSRPMLSQGSLLAA